MQPIVVVGIVGAGIYALRQFLTADEREKATLAKQIMGDAKNNPWLWKDSAVLHQKPTDAGDRGVCC